MDSREGIKKIKKPRSVGGISPARERELVRLQKLLRIRMKDIAILDRALTHRSFANENTNGTYDNERLEYLGDSVLGLIVNEYLFKRYENYHEGDLAKIKSTVVSEEILSLVAHEIVLGDYLLLGKGEEHSGGRMRDSILANAVEALIGALYLDSGMRRTKDCVLMLLKNHIEKINRMEYLRDPKTALQELVQKKYKEKPVYEVVGETGPDHQKEFIVRLVIRSREVLTGKGSSKRRAEMDAARSALEMIHEGSLGL
ncbi:MAG TPA: ribonuclease III [Spirochaetota bacterium]